MISPTECKHSQTYSLESRRIVSTVEHSAYNVFLCRDCGQFLIIGHQNEEHFKIKFYLVREDHLEAASKPVEYFNKD